MNKIIINSAVLCKQLHSLNKIVPKKATLPIIEYIKAEVKDNGISFIATDLEIRITTSPIPVTSDGECQFLIPSHFVKILRKLPTQPITITVNSDNNTVSVEAGSCSFKSATSAVKDFPSPQLLRNAEFVPAIKFTKKQSSGFIYELQKHKEFRGHDDLRPNLTGTNIELKENVLTITSTDANKLISSVLPAHNIAQDANIILPGKVCDLLVSLNSENVEVFIDSMGENQTLHNCIKIVSDNYVIDARLITEKYPDFRAVVRLESLDTTWAYVGSKQLRNEIKIAKYCAYESTNRVILDFTKEKGLEISSDDDERDISYNGKMECDVDGSDIRIGFNAVLLLDCLSTVNSDIITLRFDKPNSSVIMHHNATTILCMPVMIGDNE